MIWLVGQLLIAYALGSVSGSLVLGRFKGVDIRTQGSGNPGAANALRVVGWRFALGVVLIDIFKGVLAVAWVPQLGSAPDSAALWCGLAAILGHIWPVWHGFRGGKGGATSFGVLVVILPLAALPVLAVWLLSLSLSGYVGLATLLAALSVIPAVAWLAPTDAWWPYFIFALLLAALVGFAHRSNLQRLMQGKEARLFTRYRHGDDRP